MPSILSSKRTPSLQRINEKSPLMPSRDNLEHQMQQGSIEAAFTLASITEYRHDQVCHNCDTIASYYLSAFGLVKSNPTIERNSLLLALVQQTILFIQCHLDISRETHIAWLPMLMAELRTLGKSIKDQSAEPDRFVSLPNMDQVSNDIYIDDSIEGDYGRAVRISIYHCRAVLCEDIDTTKSIFYYRKCVSVRPSPLESQKLQQSAKLALQHLITDGHKYAADTRPRLPSRTSSVSSGASSSCPMSCSNCGVEKRGMPVCSKCKSQYYCGVRCLKAHKPVHDLECSAL